MTTNRFIVLTGDGEGLGNAVLLRLLARDQHVQVIGLSRRQAEDVDGYASLSPGEKARYVHLSVDLGDDGQVKDVIRQVGETLRSKDARVGALILVTGTGFLDTDVQAKPELYGLMEALNVTMPVALVHGLNDVMEPNAPVFYFSGVVTHPNITDPLLRTHAELKKRAAAELKPLLQDRLKIVMPGAYRTAMLEKNIVRKDALLEWYALPMADPYRKGGLADVVARRALAPHKRSPASFIRPRICKLLVAKGSSEEVTRSLPSAIRRAARGVLAETGQSDRNHDERLKFFKEQKIYGDDFPYDSIRSDRLWPTWLSRMYASSLRGLGLLS